MSDGVERLSAALADRHRIERKLGGSGVDLVVTPNATTRPGGSRV